MKSDLDSLTSHSSLVWEGVTDKANGLKPYNHLNWDMMLRTASNMILQSYVELSFILIMWFNKTRFYPHNVSSGKTPGNQNKQMLEIRIFELKDEIW